MDKMTHTKGPWRVTAEGYVSSQHDGYVPLATPFRERFFQDEAEPALREVAHANARLIAAAPELLEALEALKTWLGIQVDRAGTWECEEGELLTDVRAAINKATGE